jgi:ribonuclease-3
MDVCVTKNPGTYMLSDKMVATAVEAVMGAVYLDGGEMALELVMNESGFDVHQFL